MANSLPPVAALAHPWKKIKQTFYEQEEQFTYYDILIKAQHKYFISLVDNKFFKLSLKTLPSHH